MYKIGDGKCSVPDFVKENDPRMAYWAGVFKTVCWLHDYDYTVRKMNRANADINFRARLIKRAVNHCAETYPNNLSKLKEGLNYAEVMYKGVRYFGWWHWYVKGPIKNYFRR